MTAFLTSCAGNAESTANQEKEVEVTPEGLKASIKEMDDSLNVLMQQARKEPNYKMNRVAYHEAINRNKDFYYHFPEHDFAPDALNKIAAIYLQLDVEEEAVKWRDTLLTKYPEVENKVGLLELQMNYYDFNEYTPEKIEYYANQLLGMEGISNDQREQYEFRLKHIDKTYEELIELQLSDTLEKMTVDQPQ